MSIQHFFGSEFPAFLNQSFHILGQERVESPHHQVTLRLDLSQIPGGKIVRCQKQKFGQTLKCASKNWSSRTKILWNYWRPLVPEWEVLPALAPTRSLFFPLLYVLLSTPSIIICLFNLSPLSDSPVIISTIFVSTRHAWPHHQSFTGRIFNLGLPSQDSDQRFQLRSPNLSTVLNLALSVGSWRWISWRNFKHHFLGSSYPVADPWDSAKHHQIFFFERILLRNTFCYISTWNKTLEDPIHTPKRGQLDSHDSKSFMNLPQRLHRNNPNVLGWEDAFLKEGNPIFGSWNSACFVSQAVFDCQMYPNFGKIWCNVGNMIQYPMYHSRII